MAQNYQRHATTVYTRDNHTCRACGFYSDYAAMLSLDHIKARSEGGSDKASNLQCLCIYCNAIKSNSIAPTLPIRKRPDMNMSLREYNAMLLANRRAFYASIYGKESRGWFLQQEKTLNLLENGWKNATQFNKLLQAIRTTFNAARGGRDWAISKIQEYKELVLKSTPANMLCKFAY